MDMIEPVAEFRLESRAIGVVLPDGFIDRLTGVDAPEETLGLSTGEAARGE